jgi:NCS1 family nucleobase:cation symporter-1
VDYFIVRQGNIHIPSLYNGHPTSPYWYQGGFNIRAFVAWFIGVAVVIHGLAGSFNTNYNINSKHMYSLGMLLSFATGGTIYYILALIWPICIYPTDHVDAPKTREYMAQTDGYFDDDIITGRDMVISNEMVESGSQKDVPKGMV